jgi:hypothetical protein
LLLIGSTAFAEVKTGAWGRFLFAPAANFGGDVADMYKDATGESLDNFAFTGPNWGGRGRVGVNFSASSDNVGFSLNVDSNGNTLGVGDQAKMWIKINDMLTIQGGQIQGDVLRGKIDNSSFLGAIADVVFEEDDPATDGVDETEKASIVQGTTGKDDLFARFYPKSGILVDITPAEGVYLGVALDATTSGMKTTEDLFKTIQVGAGYMIADVGHLRGQYIGGLEKAPAWIQAAFAYTAMEGLLVDAGIKYNVGEDKVAGAQNSFTVHGTYTMDALSVLGRGQVTFGEDNVSDKMGYSVSADLGYKVADPLSVGAEVSYKGRDKFSAISVLPYGKLGYGAGYLKAGFEYSSFTKSANGDYTTWAVPIIMEYGF